MADVKTKLKFRLTLLLAIIAATAARLEACPATFIQGGDGAKKAAFLFLDGA